MLNTTTRPYHIYPLTCEDLQIAQCLSVLYIKLLPVLIKPFNVTKADNIVLDAEI